MLRPRGYIQHNRAHIEIQSPRQIDELDHIETTLAKLDTGYVLLMQPDALRERMLGESEFVAPRDQPPDNIAIPFVAKAWRGGPAGHATVSATLTKSQKV